MTDVTRILNAIEEGDERATEKLLPLVYNELRLLADRKLNREAPGQTLQATAIVHEAYLRLVNSQTQEWDSQGHFFAAAAEAMRRILVENARRKQSLKGGGGYCRVDLDEANLAVENPTVDVIALDEALEKLEKEAPQAAEVVKLRYFSGLTLEQVGKTMHCSRRTVSSYWAFAQAWLHREMTGTGEKSD